MTHLDDTTALIASGGRGSGRAIALQLAQHGAHVTVAARSAVELVETANAILAAGGRAHPIVADPCAPGAGTALARRARDQLGRVDILIKQRGGRCALRIPRRQRRYWRTSVAEPTFAHVREHEAEEQAA